jgi:hypothetical protein
MESRAIAEAVFYYGPVWRDHRKRPILCPNLVAAVQGH